MAFSKVVSARMWGVTTQNSDARLTTGDSSGGTFTGLVNPLKGSLLWDRCAYVLTGVAVAGGATGGSYTVTIQTDAVVGYTALPICSVTLGPNSPVTVVMGNSHNSPGSPLPTHMFIDQTATGGGISLQCQVLAKQYRGVLGSPASNTSERIIQGTLLRGASYAGGPFTSGAGMTVDETFALGGASFGTLGLHRMRLWDTAFYWAVAGNSIAGTHDADIIGTIGTAGTTFSIASTNRVLGAGGAVSAANEKVPIESNFGGQSPNPTAIIWTEVSAGGVSDARIVVLAKSGRGSQAKS